MDIWLPPLDQSYFGGYEFTFNYKLDDTDSPDPVLGDRSKIRAEGKAEHCIKGIHHHLPSMGRLKPKISITSSKLRGDVYSVGGFVKYSKPRLNQETFRNMVKSNSSWFTRNGFELAIASVPTSKKLATDKISKEITAIKEQLSKMAGETFEIRGKIIKDITDTRGRNYRQVIEIPVRTYSKLGDFLKKVAPLMHDIDIIGKMPGVDDSNYDYYIKDGNIVYREDSNWGIDVGDDYRLFTQVNIHTLEIEYRSGWKKFDGKDLLRLFTGLERLGKY